MTLAVQGLGEYVQILIQQIEVLTEELKKSNQPRTLVREGDKIVGVK